MSAIFWDLLNNLPLSRRGGGRFFRRYNMVVDPYFVLFSSAEE